MKITSIKDIEKLVVGDAYTIEPVGIDFNKPESIDFKVINDIQKAIELKFSTQEVIKKSEAGLKNIENILNVK